jgi:FHA domain
MDQSKKTMRHFYCRDVLWETFEQMANDFDCSIDYLINEAMRYYARSKNYHSAQATGGPEMRAGTGAVPPSSPPGAAPFAGGSPAPSAVPGGPSATSPPPLGTARRAGPPPPPAGGPRPVAGPGAFVGPAAASPASSSSPGMLGVGAGAASPSVSARRPAPPSPRPTPDQLSTTPTLFLIFNNQRIPIDKDQFIIGRGSKTSDLPIKDGNISRKHAAVIRRNGTYYIKDLGSTNGIDYKGMRIDNKRIDEGDVFHLCDYELRFTYRA